MRFMIDENVAASVCRKLRELGAEARYIRELIPEGSVDPLVAYVSQERSAILISHDGDFQKIAPRIPDGQKKRFKVLSRIQIACPEYQAADRIEKAYSFILAEYEIAQASNDKRMILQIGASFIRSNR